MSGARTSSQPRFAKQFLIGLALSFGLSLSLFFAWQFLLAMLRPAYNGYVVLDINSIGEGWPETVMLIGGAILILAAIRLILLEVEPAKQRGNRP